jgi:hypothetical protein
MIHENGRFKLFFVQFKDQNFGTQSLNMTHGTSKAVEVDISNLFVVNIDHIPYLTLTHGSARIDLINNSNIWL